MAASQPVALFGNLTRSNTLLVVHMLGESHASEIARVLGVSLSQAQKAIDSLERAGVLVGAEEGKARRVRISPRYAYREELGNLLSKMALDNVKFQQKLAETRRRPRRAGKEI